MKILMVTYASSIDGNANIDILTPAKELSRRGHVVYIISQKDSEPYQISENTGFISVIPLIPSLSYKLFAATPLLLIKIYRFIRDIRPDILIFDGDFNIPMMCFLLSTMLRVPSIVVFRETTLENICGYLTRNYFIKLGSCILLKLNYFIFHKSKYLIGIAPIIRKFYKNVLKRDDLIDVNLMCIDMDEFKPDPAARQKFRKRYNVREDEIVILYNGATQPYRRVDLLINTFRHLRNEYSNVKLFISGRGISKNELIEQAQGLGLFDSVIFVNWLPRDAVPKLISMVDICVDPYPRRAMTPSGKLLEWMSCAKCVLVARNASNLTWIDDGYNGVLFTPDDEQDLFNKLKLLLEERRLIETLGRNARSRIISNYNVQTVVLIFEGLCQRIITEA